MTTDVFTSHVTGERFNVRMNASCKSFNVIYLIQCRRYGCQYVGETGQALHSRMTGHRADIMQSNIYKPVAIHFNSSGHTVKDMAVMVIDRPYRNDPVLRKVRESRWIRTLETSCPQ